MVIEPSYLCGTWRVGIWNNVLSQLEPQSHDEEGVTLDSPAGRPQPLSSLECRLEYHWRSAAYRELIELLLSSIINESVLSTVHSNDIALLPLPKNNHSLDQPLMITLSAFPICLSSR